MLFLLFQYRDGMTRVILSKVLGYVLVTYGWQAVTWCPAGVMFNSLLVSV